jgi:DUF1009 family protein
MTAADAAAPDERTDNPLAIVAGHGDMPVLFANAARRKGWSPVIFALAGEADVDRFADFACFPVKWGEVGKLFRLISEKGCRELVLIGAVRKRPDYTAIRPDLGAVRLIPRILRIMRGGDDSVLQGVAEIFQERGVKLLTPLDVAPEMAPPEGVLTRIAPDESERLNLDKAAEAARAIGRLDIGQAAIAVGGRVVALEGVEGTDGLIKRVADLKAEGRLPRKGGTLVKCMKPNQDSRLDLPTVGPQTAELAAAAGLAGVGVESGRALLAGRDETIAAFDRCGLFLIGIGTS